MTPNSQIDAAVELRHLLAQALGQAFNLSEAAAIPMANLIADKLFDLAGGNELYIPKVDRKRRNTAIRREFNGKNRAEICQRYGISKAQLYNIVK
jgi:Mor family transcriptional regulator